MKQKLAEIGAVLGVIAGIAGTVITPIYGAGLTSYVTGIIQSLSALLVAIGAFHATSVATAKAKARITIDLHQKGIG